MGKKSKKSRGKHIDITEVVDANITLFKGTVYCHIQTKKGGRYKTVTFTKEELLKLEKKLPKIYKVMKRENKKKKKKAVERDEDEMSSNSDLSSASDMESDD